MRSLAWPLLGALLCHCGAQDDVERSASLAPINRAAASSPDVLTVLVGPDGSGQPAAAATLAALLEGSPYRLVTAPASDTVADLERIATGGADLAFVPYAAIVALRGMGPRRRALLEGAAAVAPLPMEVVHVIGRRKAHFAGYDDLIGERLGVGPARSSSHLAAWTVLFHAAALDIDGPAAAERLPLDVGLERVGAGKLDAQLLCAPLGVPWLRQLPPAVSRNLELLSLPEAWEVPRELRGVYALEGVDAGTYAFQPKKVWALATRSYLLGTRRTSAALEHLVEVLFEQADAVRAKDRTWSEVSAERVRRDLGRGIPYHPATLRMAGVEVE